MLRELADDPGVYVPCDLRGRSTTVRRSVASRRGSPACPRVVEKRTVADLADWPYPKQQLVPLVEVVHDRLNVEIFRGCTRGCRFCQAGMITRPVRERPAEQVRTMVARRPAPHRLRRGRAHVAVDRRLLRASTISSPISSAINRARGCVGAVAAVAARRRVHRRHRRRDPEGPAHRSHVRARSGHVAHAPGDQQAHHRGRPLRRASTPRSQGWRRVKLYFLTGLPTETDDDTLGIAELAANVVEIGRQHTKGASCTGIGRRVRAEAAHAVPVVRSERRRRAAAQGRTAPRRHCAARACSCKWHDPEATFAEGIASRGDRRIGA